MNTLFIKIKSALTSRIGIWLWWVITFYCVWLTWIFTQDLIPTLKDHWEIAVAMLIGSYAAGSTPMGGGSVGFPVLVMLMDMPASLGRDFSFAIQSIGMTSASILIFCRRQAVDYQILVGAAAGALIGTPLGIFMIAPYVDELIMKLVFATIWAGFGVLHITRIKEISANSGSPAKVNDLKMKLGFFASLLSTSTVCSVTGVGVDMVIYSILILLFRSDLKVAVPTSVVIMAFTSLIGVAIKLTRHDFEVGVYENWLTASAVVILGAPLGVIVVDLIGRKPTLFIVALTCIAQYVWVCVIEYQELGVLGVLVSLVAVVSIIFCLEALRKKGLAWAMLHSDEETSIKFSNISQGNIAD